MLAFGISVAIGILFGIYPAGGRPRWTRSRPCGTSRLHGAATLGLAQPSAWIALGLASPGDAG